MGLEIGHCESIDNLLAKLKCKMQEYLFWYNIAYRPSVMGDFNINEFSHKPEKPTWVAKLLWHSPACWSQGFTQKWEHPNISEQNSLIILLKYHVLTKKCSWEMPGKQCRDVLEMMLVAYEESRGIGRQAGTAIPGAAAALVPLSCLMQGDESPARGSRCFRACWTLHPKAWCQCFILTKAIYPPWGWEHLLPGQAGAVSPGLAFCSSSASVAYCPKACQKSGVCTPGVTPCQGLPGGITAMSCSAAPAQQGHTSTGSPSLRLQDSQAAPEEPAYTDMLRLSNEKLEIQNVIH